MQFDQDRRVVRSSTARRLAAPCARDVFVRVAHYRAVCWLDSSRPAPGDGRWSILVCEPRWIFSARAGAWELRSATATLEQGTSGALERLEALRQAHHAAASAAAPHLPFFGGAIGWLAYDLVRQLETLPTIAAIAGEAPPDIWFGWYDAAIVWDHALNQTWLVGADEGAETQAAADRLRAAIETAPIAASLCSNSEPGGSSVATSDFRRDDYERAVADIREGIARGDFYQLNLVQQFVCPQRESAASTYLRLRAVNPAPFSAFINTGDPAVLSSSPERFLEVSDSGFVRTCPIKGTRPRDSHPTVDAARREELITSPKERAELLMIVDLLRNDLGRICVPGSITVPRLHALESFATVHHLVGEVVGRMRDGTSLADILRAVFPGGSITGAPKVSAMIAIERLERHRRGIAMGAIGYLSNHGRIDLNIAIRTIVIHHGEARIAVGAGIVWDSEPTTEYAETLAKAAALFSALGVRAAEE